MKPMTNKAFADAVMQLRAQGGEFKPTATYIPEGDCIEFVIAPDDYTARRLDGLVTVYYSRETGEVVGSVIKGAKSLCKRILARCPGFKIEIDARTVKLEHIFLAHLWLEPREEQDVLVRTYRELIAVAEAEDLQVEMSLT